MRFKGIKLSLWQAYFLTKISKKEFISGHSQLLVDSASCVYREHLSNDSFHHHGTLSHPYSQKIGFHRATWPSSSFQQREANIYPTFVLNNNKKEIIIISKFFLSSVPFMEEA